MSRESDSYLKDVPMKRYDLLYEGLAVFAIIALLVIILAAVFSSPEYPTVRGEDVAKRQPLLYLKTSANILAGNSALQTYGPPYTHDMGNAQSFLGIAPANLFGVTIPINAKNDLILKPLARVSALDPGVASALKTYKAAPEAQKKTWLKNYMAALDKAKNIRGQANIPPGDYGPVSILMDGMLRLGRAGLLEGALASDPNVPYMLNPTRSLLFFQEDVQGNVAKSLDMLGNQWGLINETGNYPGAWWLWTYAFLYQIPPMNSSANADLQVGIIMTLLFLLLLFAPVIPIINRIPKWIGIHRIIWRDWYDREEAEENLGERKAG